MSSTSNSTTGSSAAASTALESLWATAQMNEKTRAIMAGGKKIKCDLIPEFELSAHLDVIEQRFELSNIEYVGGGACGSVYSGTQKGSTDLKYSFKVVSANQNMPHTLLRFTKNTKTEVNILQRLNHENIVKFYDCFKINDDYYQVPFRFLIKMEQLDITIGQAITVSKLTESQCLRLLTQIGGAINYMHQLGIAHHDIKTDNIMIEKIDRLSELSTCHYKLIDFGIAKIYDTPIKSTLDQTRRGTLAYLAPEKCSWDGYNPFLTDAYALGCSLLITMIGQDEFLEVWDKTKSLPDGVANRFLGDTKIARIVARLIDNDPQQRFFVEEALELRQT